MFLALDAKVLVHKGKCEECLHKIIPHLKTHRWHYREFDLLSKTFSFDFCKKSTHIEN